MPEIGRGERWLIESIADAIPDAVALVELDDRVVAWNRAMADLVEIPPTVALGTEFTALDVSYRVPRLRAALEDAKRTLEVVRAELSVPRRDGGMVTATATLNPARDGSRLAILIHVRRDREGREDLEGQLQIENARLLTGTEELLTLNEELRETRDHLETELARLLVTRADTAVMGKAVSGLLALVRARRIDQPTADRGFALLVETPRLEARVLGELAELEALSGGHVRLDRTDVALETVAAHAVDHVASDASAARVRVDLTTSEPIVIRADRRRLEQVASTLIGNAVRFTPAGGRVDVQVGRQGPVARLTVVDTGCGLSPDLLPSVFEPFRRGNGRAPGAHRGLGLRLAIAHGLVQLHGGVIRAESAGEDQGTTMTVRLPVSP